MIPYWHPRYWPCEGILHAPKGLDMPATFGGDYRCGWIYVLQLPCPWKERGEGDSIGGQKLESQWHRGNFESRLEFFGGMQFYPNVDTDGWFIGLTPHLRYDFATGTRWIPFVDAGAGVS